ncbi:MAG: hypothetical protein ACKO40_09755 [Planctomycetaceae bacterium]
MDTQTIINLLVSLIAGGAGGNIVTALLKNKTLTPVLTTVLGSVGGIVGGNVLPKLIPVIGTLVGGDANHVGTGVLSAIVGALLPLIVSFLKKPAVAA